MRTVIARPATIVVTQGEDPDVTLITHQAVLDDDYHDGETVVEYDDGETVRAITLATIEVNEHGLVRATTLASGYDLLVRPVEPDDAVAFDGLPPIPLPVEVIQASLAGENMDTHVEALAEDDGMVSTLLLVTDVGLWTRFSGSWIATKVETIDGLRSVEVAPEAVELYDSADRAGRQLPLASYPITDDTAILSAASIGALYVADSADRAFKTGDGVVATAASAELPVIASARDLIAAAETAEESIRWYLERRRDALKIDVRFPWE